MALVSNLNIEFPQVLAILILLPLGFWYVMSSDATVM